MCLKQCKFSLDDYRAFYEIIREWSVKSHRNQKITSEVIINMLLSSFIGEIVSFALKTNTKVKLLAKEFPIEVFLNNNDYLQYASADYLLYDRNTLYLTELKTTSAGADGKQILNMLYNCKEGMENFWTPLRKIIFNRIEKKNTELPTQKYLYTLCLIAKNLGLNEWDFSGLSVCGKKNNRGFIAEDIIEKSIQKLKEREIKIIYISLYDISYDEVAEAAQNSLKCILKKEKNNVKSVREYRNTLDESLKKYLLKPIVIEDIVKNPNLKMPIKKQAAWNMVRNIFEELLESPDNWFRRIK